MFSMMKSLGGLLWDRVFVKEDHMDEENDLEICLRGLEEEVSVNTSIAVDSTSAPSSCCFELSGVVTDLSGTGGFIDGKYNFSMDNVGIDGLKLNDIVYYIAYQPDDSKILKVVKITSVQELQNWCPTNNSQLTVDSSDNTISTRYETEKRVLNGKVVQKIGRIIIIEPNHVKFCLDSVVSNFLPMLGDWVEIQVIVQVNNTTYIKNQIGEILEVESLCCLRSQTIEGKITQWDEENRVGIINNTIFVPRSALEMSYTPKLGDQVAVDAIESDQGKLMWRAITVALLFSPSDSSLSKKKAIDSSNTIINKNGITISQNVDFGTLAINESKELTLEIFNGSSHPQKLKRGVFHSQKKMSQLTIGANDWPIILQPKETMNCTFRCSARFMGFTEEKFIFEFDGFSIARVFKISVADPSWLKKNFGVNTRFYSEVKSREYSREFQQNSKMQVIPGIRTVKPPTFIKNRLPYFTIPNHCLNTVLECYESKEGITNLCVRLEKSFPVLIDCTNFKSYLNRFHMLLYFEEIHNILSLKKYDMPNVFMDKSQQYLTMVVEGLAEKRPSLVIGDSVHVRNPWSEEALEYQGFIHKITSNTIYLKFCDNFHRKYNGEDLSVNFHCSRSIYIKFHQAIELVSSHLGREILFPDRIKIKPSQIHLVEENDVSMSDNDSKSTLKHRTIKWNNKNLNSVQKEAVRNILRGVSRPLPYIIFGPPGTGKTIVLIETIVQLLCLVTESRILIATPSNSSADTIAERLIDCINIKPGFLARILANHVASSGNVSEKLKPYCVTVDISLETSHNLNSTYKVGGDGIQYNCPMSLIGRHRVTIGTCTCLGALLKIGLPEDHFTHVIIDEAGQAIEPEVMIPLSLIRKNTGQIILAGDPMQLGPIILSLFADSYGLGESYLERLLKCFPYQRDTEGFGDMNGGYDPRVVTRLVHNYRSIPNLLKLPSKMFYDNSLIPQISPSTSWVAKDVDILSRIIFDDTTNIKSSPFPGLIFHGIRGTNLRGQDSPSWYNLHEAAMVMMFTCKLYKHGYSPEDIGIISPYLQQIKQIQLLFNDMDMETPKIGSVEEFQGQERKIIILSTVRSTDSLVQIDVKHSLGFMKNPKRLNVALTRAKVLLIIFGNPHLLCLDPLWCKVINYAVSNGGYLGCNLPKSIED